jgi:malonyl-CoA O-methyltransferase
MPQTRVQHRIQNAFSRCAGQYEDLTDLQAQIGEELLERIKEHSPQTWQQLSAILDVGAGTGRMLPQLQSVFPAARIIGMDLAFGMLSVARKKNNHARLIQADAARLPFKDNIFDLVVSNVSYQWVQDLEQAFGLIHSVLKPEGVFYLTMFGYESLRELFAAFESTGLTSGDNGRPQIKRLPRSIQIYQAATAAGFKRIEKSRETRRIYFKDMLALLRWLKGIGANTLGANIFLGKDGLKKASAYYRSHFSQDGRGYASFEVIGIKAQKMNQIANVRSQ